MLLVTAQTYKIRIYSILLQLIEKLNVLMSKRNDNKNDNTIIMQQWSLLPKQTNQN